MELLYHPLEVEPVNLMTSPKYMAGLAASGRLLVAWRRRYSDSDLESGDRYHLAFYHPDYGWRACRWDKKHGFPFYVLPVSENAVWVNTDSDKLIYISLEDEVKATMLLSGKSEFLLLYGDHNRLWIRERYSTQIVKLCLQDDGLTIIDKKSLARRMYSMYPLADGAWMLVGDENFVVLSPSLEKVICEDKREVSLHPPFLVRKFRRYYHYTEDPRQGWNKTPIKGIRKDDFLLFFAKQGDIYYAIVYRRHRNYTALYRFSDEAKQVPQVMWLITGGIRFMPRHFVLYNDFLCIVDKGPLTDFATSNVPENHGFLAFHLRSGVFYKDIPQPSAMNAKHIISCNFQISTAWSGEGKRQHLQNA